jgi:aspartate kinase
MKFGGTSVADAACMEQVASLVQEALPHAPLVVLSAMSKTTDALFGAARLAEAGRLEEALEAAAALRARHGEAADRLFGGAVAPELAGALDAEFAGLEVLLRGVAMLRELSPRSMDAIAGTGELLSTRVFGAFLAARGVPVTWFDARRALLTDRRFGQARPNVAQLKERARSELQPLLARGSCVVTQGYIGATEDGLTTTLGRGGSDYSAALFGAALGAREVQIWTDVEGVMTCDPRIVPDARPIPRLSFAEAAELAAFGAKVLHPATIQPAVEARIPVTVRHTFVPHGRFTTITADGSAGRPVTALAARAPITVLTVTSSRMLEQSGYLARMFEIFGRLGVSVDLVTTAEVSVSLSIDADAPLDQLVAELGAIARVDVARERAIVSVIGERMKTKAGLPARVFDALAGIEVEMISLGANEINLSVVVRREAATDALRRLHRALLGVEGADARAAAASGEAHG